MDNEKEITRLSDNENSDVSGGANIADSGKQFFICPKCNKRFDDERKFAFHLDSHNMDL